MIDTTASLLIVEGDQDFARMLAAEATTRAYDPRTVASLGEALNLVVLASFDLMLVAVEPGSDEAFDLLGRLKDVAPETEVVVMSNRTPITATIQWFDPEAFAFVRKSDLGQLFAALGRGLERRRITAQNRRLVWELQTINEIGSVIARSLEQDDVLNGALQRLVHAMDGIGGSIRLRNDVTGVYETCASIGPPALTRLWNGQATGFPRPSDEVIATRSPVVVEDFTELVADQDEPLPLLSAISVPMLAGDELVGTLSLGSLKARRFTVADEKLLMIIVGQIVVAVQNARLHQSMRRAKREWEQIFDAINDPIAVFNNRGEVLRANRALAAHLSLPIQAMRRLTCADVGFCGGHDGGTCNITRALGQEEARGEVTLAGGQIFSVTTFPVGFSSEGPSVVQVAKNVTEEISSARRLKQMSDELGETNGRLVAAMEQLKSTQAQLVQSEKLSAIGYLVSGVAHELNNPLTSVIGYSQLVEEELREGPSTRPPQEVAQDLRRIADEAERAARIVRNLLAFARRQSVARAPQDINEICERVLALREYEFKVSGVELTTDLPADLPQVLADGGQLQQVLLNLVLNAEHAMRGRAARRLSVGARFVEEAGAIELSVTDSGHGIETGNLSRIFDPFFTTRDVGEGTGLGLSICYGIVRDHGGHIRVASRSDEGTTFHVTLPARLSDPAVHDTTVLIAHGEQSEREFIGAALCGWGYRVVPVGTTSEALERYKARGLQVAVVDRNIIMADLQAWVAVRAGDTERVALVLTSVSPDDRAIERFTRDEAAAALVPPIELRALHGAVRAGSKECV
jgi:signal transduction histidine kinase/DNA-binding response OmpR family regulator